LCALGVNAGTPSCLEVTAKDPGLNAAGSVLRLDGLELPDAALEG